MLSKWPPVEENTHTAERAVRISVTEEHNLGDNQHLGALTGLILTCTMDGIRDTACVRGLKTAVHLSSLSYLELGVQVSVRGHHVLVLLLARGFDEDLLGLPELFLHSSHHRAVLAEQSPAAAQHVPREPADQSPVSEPQRHYVKS